MYKTIDFNIFEEFLEEIVYGKKSPAQVEVENVSADKKTTVTKAGEITIPKITEQKTEQLIYKDFESKIETN